MSKDLLYDELVSAPDIPYIFMSTKGELPEDVRNRLFEWREVLLDMARHAQVFEATSAIPSLPIAAPENCVDCLPPFRETWVEFERAKSVYDQRIPSGRTGFLVYSAEWALDVARKSYDTGEPDCLRGLDECDGVQTYGVSRFSKGISADGESRLGWSPHISLLRISKTGTLHTDRPLLISFVKRGEDQNSLYDDTTLPLVAAMFFGMLNCKNIVTVDEQRRKNQAARLAKKTGRPCDTYKTLRIKVGGELVRFPSADPSGEHRDQALHRVRGHFKTYTQEKPLLGRFTGRYFWHPHIRGNEEFGRIHKRYKATYNEGESHDLPQE